MPSCLLVFEKFKDNRKHIANVFSKLRAIQWFINAFCSSNCVHFVQWTLSVFAVSV